MGFFDFFKPVPSITAEEVTKVLADKKMKKQYSFVDVRHPDDFSRGHLSGAIAIPLAHLASAAPAKLSKDKTIVVYCNSGNQSRFAVKMLNNMGFENVLNLKGGLKACL